MPQELINKADISDVLIERPICFSVAKRDFLIYQPSLGKIQLLSRLLENIGLGNNGTGATNKNIDIYAFSQAIKTKRDDCLRIIAYSTLPGADCLNESLVRKQIKDLSSLNDTDLSSLLMIVLTTGDKTESIIKHFGMDKEAKKMADITKIKKSKNVFTFGGRSMWGSLIDAACERYKWTYQYVLWGISFSNLRLLLADQEKVLFLTDEELKKVRISKDDIVIRASNVSELNKFIKQHSWK